jgi:cytochrome c oxidase subunit 3
MTSLAGAQREEPAEQFVELAQQQEADLLGMWLFLATETMLFGGVFLGFAISRLNLTAAFAAAAQRLDLLMGSINTVILLSSGLSMALADVYVRAHRRRASLLCLTATLMLGLAFLGLKAHEYHHEYQEHLMPLLGLPFAFKGTHAGGARLFFDFYYTLTGLHAVHMALGLGILCVLLVLCWRWREPSRLARQVQIAGMYWALVDVVWIFVFTCLYLLRH